MKALKMKNPPHPGFSVRVDCLEPHGLSVTDEAKVLHQPSNVNVLRWLADLGNVIGHLHPHKGIHLLVF